VNMVEIGTLIQKIKLCSPATLERPVFRYIDISSIDRQNKTIVEAQPICSNAAPSRARKLVCAGDVLVSTVRPNLNAVALVPKQYDSEIASTGFCVLRPSKSVIDPAYLYYFVQTERFIQRLVQLATGAGYPAVSDTDIWEAPIPLPLLNEQKRIAAQLDKADCLRRSRRYVHELSDNFLQSVFLDMFGDPVANPHSWERGTIGDIATKITDGEHITPQRTISGVKLLSARNIKNGFIDFSTGLDFIPEQEYQRIKKRCDPQRGDILMSCSGSIGRITTVNITEPFSLVRSVALIKLDSSHVLPNYVEHYLRTPYSQQLINQTAHQSSQANIFTGQIRELPLYIPPLLQQEKFAVVVQRMERLRAQQHEAERQAEHLFQTLLHCAFSN